MIVEKLTEEEIKHKLINPQEKGLWYLKGTDGQVVILSNEILVHALLEGVEKLGYRLSNNGILETWH